MMCLQSKRYLCLGLKQRSHRVCLFKVLITEANSRYNPKRDQGENSRHSQRVDFLVELQVFLVSWTAGNKNIVMLVDVPKQALSTYLRYTWVSVLYHHISTAGKASPLCTSGLLAVVRLCRAGCIEKNKKIIRKN